MRILSVFYGFLGTLVFFVGGASMALGFATNYGISSVEKVAVVLTLLIVILILAFSCVEAWKQNAPKSLGRTFLLIAPILLIGAYAFFLTLPSSKY